MHPHIIPQHPPIVTPTPWLDSKAAPSPPEVQNNSASHTHAQPQPTSSEMLEFVGQGVMGRQLRELEGGLAYPDSGLHFVTDLFCDMEQVVQPPWASVHSWRASAAPSAFQTSFNVWQGVGPSPALQLVKAKRKNTSTSVPTQDGPI